MTKNTKNWAVANSLFFVLFLLMIFFAFVDYMQLQTFHELNTAEAWQLYYQYTSPALILLWMALIIVPVFVYWLFTRDLSETLGLASAGLIMLFAGVEDVFFFLFSPAKMTDNMCWFNDVRGPVAKFSELLGAECVTQTHLLLFAGLGIVLAFVVYQIFKHIEFNEWF